MPAGSNNYKRVNENCVVEILKVNNCKNPCQKQTSFEKQTGSRNTSCCCQARCPQMHPCLENHNNTIFWNEQPEAVVVLVDNSYSMAKDDNFKNYPGKIIW